MNELSSQGYRRSRPSLSIREILDHLLIVRFSPAARHVRTKLTLSDVALTQIII